MQTSYSLEHEAGFSGMKADTGVDDIKSMMADVVIPFGRAVVKSYGKDNAVRLPILGNLVITDDAGTFTAGTITATVLGTLVSQAFDTDKNTSMTALAVKIAAIPGVSSAVYSSGSHTITIVTKSTSLEGAVVDISGITGAMTISSYVYTTADTILGFAVATHKEQTAAGLVQYEVGEAVNVMSKGRLYSYVEEALGSDDTSIYFRCRVNGSTKQIGQVLKTSTVETSGTNSWAKGTIAAGVKFLKTITGAGLTILEVNLPQ